MTFQAAPAPRAAEIGCVRVLREGSKGPGNQGHPVLDSHVRHAWTVLSTQCAGRSRLQRPHQALSAAVPGRSRAKKRCLNFLSSPIQERRMPCSGCHGNEKRRLNCLPILDGGGGQHRDGDRHLVNAAIGARGGVGDCRKWRRRFSGAVAAADAARAGAAAAGVWAEARGRAGPQVTTSASATDVLCSAASSF